MYKYTVTNHTKCDDMKYGYLRCQESRYFPFLLPTGYDILSCKQLMVVSHEGKVNLSGKLGLYIPRDVISTQSIAILACADGRGRRGIWEEPNQGRSEVMIDSR